MICASTRSHYLAHHGVDLAHVNSFHARVTGHFSKNTAVPTSHNQHLDCITLREQHNTSFSENGIRACFKADVSRIYSSVLLYNTGIWNA